MDGKMFARLGAVVFVGIAITATAIEMTRRPEEPASAPVETVREHGDADMLRTLLRRCRDMGEAATRDSVCLRAWAENRRRFLKQDAEASDAPGAPATLWPSESGPAEDPIRKEFAPVASPTEPEVR